MPRRTGFAGRHGATSRKEPLRTTRAASRKQRSNLDIAEVKATLAVPLMEKDS
jgi:hypothetical protein